MPTIFDLKITVLSEVITVAGVFSDRAFIFSCFINRVITNLSNNFIMMLNLVGNLQFLGIFGIMHSGISIEL